MGYTITIGQAVIIGHDDPEGWEGHLHVGVEDVTLPEAPAFPHDLGSAHRNSRAPSYQGWTTFLDKSGLHALFMDPETGLMRLHPGCFLLQEDHERAIDAALVRYQTAHPHALPGFESWDGKVEDDRHDATLGRLLWLDWWVRWARQTCAIPAIENS